MTLYELKGDFERLYELAQDPEVDPEAIEGALESLDGCLEIKADGCAKVVRQLKADAEALKVEADRLTKRKQACWNGVERIQNMLQETMIAAGKPKFKTELFSFGIQKNPPSVVIDHPELVPEAYIVPQEPKFDKAAIKDLLNSGDAVACHFAHMEQSEGLRIR